MDNNQKSLVESLPFRDQVADIVRRMIITGELKSGEPISERQISQMLNVSTTPVKEAFRILQTEGMISIVRRKGSFVADRPQDMAMQVVSMRSALEGVGASFTTKNATDEQLEIMENALNESGRLMATTGCDEEGDAQLFKQNKIFHSTLRAAAHNNYLNNMLETLRSIEKTFSTMSFHTTPEYRKNAYYEHKEILEAVKERNGEKAESLMVKHLRNEARLVIFGEE